jgi:group II intron reverse transcriptase/maturase
MNGHGESDRPIVPKKLPNKGSGAPQPAEEVEGRGRTKGNPRQRNRDRAQHRASLQQALDRIRQAARKDQKQRFTTLWHHVYNIDRLREVYFSLKRESAPGTDGETWQSYGETLEENLLDLSERLKRGAYRAKPVERIYLLKPDGRQRPIGIPTLEDKLVQRTTAQVLGAIYEEDFLGFSYGFRPKRHQHQALDAVSVGIQKRRVNWVLDADIRGFFDAIDHEWLMKFIEHRIADKRVLRHIRKWLNAGVLEDEEWRPTEEGTPQGGSISPLLGNIYLHYVFDLWAHQWRKTQANGKMIMVRFADDIILGFESRDDATRFQTDLTERLRKFGLELNSDKTQLIEFGRHAAKTRERRGEGKPETFDFLGFTHICSTNRRGYFIVLRQTICARRWARLKVIHEKLRKRTHVPIPVVGRWLRSVWLGYMRYHAVPGNMATLWAFRAELTRLWHLRLRRRSQKGYVNWKRMSRLERIYLPRPRVCHLYPDQRLRVNTTQGRSPVR